MAEIGIKKIHIYIMVILLLLSLGFNIGAYSSNVKISRDYQYLKNQVQNNTNDIHDVRPMLQEITLNLKTLCAKLRVEYIETK